MKNEKELEQAKPYLRSAVALALYLCGKASTIDESYGKADEYIDTLDEDVRGS